VTPGVVLFRQIPNLNHRFCRVVVKLSQKLERIEAVQLGEDRHPEKVPEISHPEKVPKISHP
jgi:hypothetical protein